MNPEAMKAVVNRNVINYLDNAITRLARGLPAAMLAGTTVGVASNEESASRAVVAPRGGEGPGGLRDFGGVAAPIGGGRPTSGSRAAKEADEEEEEEDDAATRRAVAKEAKAGDARSALFARPAGRAAPKAPSPEPEEEEVEPEGDGGWDGPGGEEPVGGADAWGEAPREDEVDLT